MRIPVKLTYRLFRKRSGIWFGEHRVTRQQQSLHTRNKAFDLIRSRVIIEDQPEPILAVLRQGTVITIVFLRRLQNFCLDMNGPHWSLGPKRQWPPVRRGNKRALTCEKHQSIIERETNTDKTPSMS